MYIQSLDGAWELRQCGSEEVIKAQVPGCVHLDLMRNKKIEDPFWGDNEFRVSWVHECDWHYSRSFQLDKKLLEADRVYLECDGLDTIADVAINDHVLGRTDNMYVQHRFDVTDRIKPGSNSLYVNFASCVNYAKPYLEKDPLLCPGDSIPGSIYTRKSPCQWGWDWGPKIPTSGIWRPIRLVGYKIARIEDLRVRQKHKNGQVTLSIEASIERFTKGTCTVTFKLNHPDGTVEEREVRPIASRAKWSIVVDNPQLWWPNGYGKQPLYSVEAVLKCGDVELHSCSRRIGLRTIKLDQQKDEYGRGFTFVVNGVKVFCKGADWIPADQFPSRLNCEHYRHLISSAASANMNMLRVWGGGFYEDECFYDLCDEYGILIWQDFMFACAFYPIDSAYLENVRRDVEYNVIRLRDRTCLALWCGNNEIEWFLAEGWGKEQATLRKRQYTKLFHEFIPSIVSKLDTDTFYWPSSPSSGPKPFDDPNGQDFGDGHYWGVWHGRQPFQAYRTQYHRFQSEFGFQSLPCFETVKSFAAKEDWNMTSRVMECHQKNGDGNSVILHYMAQSFRFPKNFEMTCYVSQLLQAEAMRYGVEHWRRNRDRCMGTLYWQFNDCWPVVSWAGIDYYGRWKALHYFAKRFYSPVLLSIAEEEHRAEMHVTNDTTKPVKIEFRWWLERLDGTVIRKSKIKTRIEAESSKQIGALNLIEELAGDSARQVVLVHELLVNGKRTSLGLTPFVPSKHLELSEPKIEVEVKSDDDGYYLEVSSDVTARFVCLSVPKRDVIFSDNFFDLPARRTVTVRVESDIDEAALSKVRAWSLRDSY